MTGDEIMAFAERQYFKNQENYKNPYREGSNEFNTYERGWMQALKRDGGRQLVKPKKPPIAKSGASSNEKEKVYRKLFKNFKEASAFVKGMDQKIRARIKRHGVEFVVENNVSFDAPNYQQQDPQPSKTKGRSLPADISGDTRLCIGCSKAFPAERIYASPWVLRCTDCQSAYERSHDTRPHINEGLADTREGHKRLRSQLGKDMRNRARGH